MNDDNLKLISILRSKLARRLIPTFVAVVAIPLTATVFVVGQAGREQIVAMARSTEKINSGSVKEAGQEFQDLGLRMMGGSAAKTASISQNTAKAVSKQWEKNQAESLAATRDEVTRLTSSSVNDAMKHSLKTNNTVLQSVSGQMDELFSNSARYTQARLVGSVQTALVSQIKTQLQDRATQLSASAETYIQSQQDYLTLTAQMLNLYHGDAVGQKAVLDALLRRFPMFVVVSVLNPQGQETAMSGSDYVFTSSDLTNQSGSLYFQQVMRDKPYVGVDQVPTDGHAPELRLAVPIEEYHGKVSGVLAARLSLDDLWDTIRTAHIGQSGFAYVDDGYEAAPPQAKGAAMIEQSAPIETLGWRVVVAQSRDEVMAPVETFRADIESNTKSSLTKVHGDLQVSSAIAAKRLRQDAGHLGASAAQDVQGRTQAIFDGVQRKSLRQSNTVIAGMQAALRVQEAKARQEADRQMMSEAQAATADVARRDAPLTARALQDADKRLSLFALVIIAGSCGAGCVIGLFLAGKLVRPILRLAKGTQAIAEGKLDNRVDERAPAELGDLAVAFNTMAASLQQSREDLKGAEAQLVQSAKLASLGTLSAGVAHELNQPVAIVRGIAQQLQDEPGLSPATLEDLTVIEGQTGRMMKIIKHMRTFCHAGGVEMDEVDVNQVIENCFILISAQLNAHAVAVTLHLSESKPYILGDANELEQVFINLITNARDALDGRAGAELCITTRADGNSALIEFRDNGPGIPDRIAAHIFDPFFTTKEAGKGTGLGLSISHGIVKKHQGAIVVHNDGGAVFTITLPLIESIQEAAELELLAA